MRKREHIDRIARVRLLSAELDRLRVSSVERTRSIDTKASFVVVAAGVLASQSVAGMDGSRAWLLSVVPLALTIATVITAAIALWPIKLESPSGRYVVDAWVDAKLAPAELDDTLLEVKAVEVEYRDRTNESKGRATKWAFVLLIASLGSTFLVTVSDNAIMNGEPANGETSITTPAPTEAPGCKRGDETIDSFEQQSVQETR